MSIVIKTMALSLIILCKFLYPILVVSGSEVDTLTKLNENQSEYDEHGLPSELHPKVRDMLMKHKENIFNIEKSYDEEKKGHDYFRKGQYEQALEQYIKAHELTVGPKGVTGFLIAETYEKLGQYQEAIEILKTMIDTKQYNEEGNAQANTLIKQYSQQKNEQPSL